MAKSPAYAQWLIAMAEARKAANDNEIDGCEDILAYISIQSENNNVVRNTNLVQSLLFGSGPTVARKVKVLLERRLIVSKDIKSDARAKNLLLTQAGRDLLNERTKQMIQILKLYS